MRKLYFTLAVAIFTVGFSSKTISQSVDPYNPLRFGIPETVGGYRVLAVLTGDNFTCMKGREKRLVLQSPQPSIKDGPRDFPKELIEQELRAPNLIESTHWEWSIVGPGVTREQLVSQYEQSHRFFNAHGCPALDLPDASGEEKCPFITGNELIGGEARCPPPYQGYAILRNLIADEDLGNNGQSVILIAPSVGNNHGGWTECDITRVPPCLKYDGYSAFLNNGVTDKGYFLQVGLYFTDRPDPLHPFRGSPPISECVNLAEPAPGNPFSPEGIGWVVFAGAKIEEAMVDPSVLRARALCVPYTSGHHYYTTIAYSSGTWWTCAADMQDPTTYRCQEHPQATEIGSTHLINHQTGTSVFAENWNNNATWTQGFPYQWAAYEARIYKEGIGYPWKSEAKLTLHSCNNKSWPHESAIGGGLVPVGSPVNDGYAFFNIDYLPLYCE